MKTRKSHQTAAPVEPRHNRLYRRNKDKIVLSTLRLMRGRFSVTGKAAARNAGVVRQTVWRIFGKAERIVPVWERETVKELREYLGARESMAHGLDGVKSQNEIILQRLFIFLGQRKEPFVAASETAVGHEILRSLAEVVYERLSITWVPHRAAPLNDGGEAVDIFFGSDDGFAVALVPV